MNSPLTLAGFLVDGEDSSGGKLWNVFPFLFLFVYS